MAEELFKLLDDYFTEHELNWGNCLGFCSDGAQTMAGKRNGLRALIKRAAPNAEWTHCVIHREALASKHLSPELNEVLTAVVDVVNFIKTRPLKARLFTAVCEEMGADHTAVLFHSEARWLSRGKVLSRIFELRSEIRVFLEEERMYEAAAKFGDDMFLIKLAYLSDIFSKLNELNLQLQGKDKHLPHLADKINTFTRKLNVWEKRMSQGRTDVFENLTELAESIDSGATTVLPCIQQHIEALGGFFGKYFPNSATQYDWVVDPFHASAPADFSCAEEEQLIEMTSDSALRGAPPSSKFCSVKASPNVHWSIGSVSPKPFHLCPISLTENSVLSITMSSASEEENDSKLSIWYYNENKVKLGDAILHLTAVEISLDVDADRDGVVEKN
ncbi:Zinc finger MYM-type protein 6 [Larimichthys crocea]|uniref:Zinc finger MYM-type protein 6 n=1 Tax=Larimichthys crocea TaxID=215358 RepID=A0A6G0J3D5_LARCR|nr:Zinc finger MYM-type protein 6 [Larimichthys crocea]